MFESKSTRLINECDLPEPAGLYKHKSLRVKYIVILALICFVLLIILANVNYTGKAYMKNLPIVTIPKIRTVDAAAPIAAITFTESVVSSVEIGNTDMSVVHSIKSPVLPASSDGAFKCKELLHCKSIVCHGGPITKIDKEVELITKWCPGPYDLLIENCTFSKDTIGASTLDGFFKLIGLTIRNCTLKSITTNAFKHFSLRLLENLALLQTQLTTLDKKTLTGLEMLTNFTLINIEQKGKPLTATSFLKPVSSTLSAVMLQQLQQEKLYVEGVVHDATVYNPADWLSGAVMSALLHVDMRGNNFGATLNSGTFSNLPQVQVLILADCNINAIGADTFNKVLRTLTLLDLSGNTLHTIDGDLLATAALAGVRLELDGNAWHCDCDNDEIMRLLTAPELLMQIQPKCATPEEWCGMNMKYVKSVYCDGETPTTTPTTVTTTTAATVTTTSSSTTTISSSVGETTSSEITSDSTETSDTTTSTTVSTTISTTQKSTTNSETTLTPTNTAAQSGETNITDETNETDETDWTTIPSSTITTTPSITTTTTPFTTITTTTASTGTVTDPPTALPTFPSGNECSNKLGYIYCSIALTGVCDYDATFNVVFMSSNSVVVHITESTSSVKLVYFSDTNWTELTTATISGGGWFVVNDLTYNCSYTFCLVPNGEHKMSPFNCRSLFVPFPVPSAWLLKSSITLFFLLGGVGVIICMTAGVLAVYWLLRSRPVLMRGNKRLHRIDSTSKEMLLFPKSDRSSMDTKQQTFREWALARATASSNVESCGYQQCYKDTNLNRREPAYIIGNLPPKQCAPALPLQQTGHGACTNVQLRANRYDNENLYESLD